MIITASLCIVLFCLLITQHGIALWVNSRNGWSKWLHRLDTLSSWAGTAIDPLLFITGFVGLYELLCGG